MAEDNDIVFTLRAINDTDSAFNKVKQNLEEMEAYGKRITEAFRRLGLPMTERTKGLMSPSDRAAVEAYEASLKRVVNTTNEVGAASQRAGFNVAGMVEHMVTRMAVAAAIFESIRLATKGIQPRANPMRLNVTTMVRLDS